MTLKYENRLTPENITKIETKSTMEVMTEKPKSRRGFAAMSPEKRQALARLGGAAVPHNKRSFSQNRELAAAAGRKGGEKSKRTVENNE